MSRLLNRIADAGADMYRRVSGRFTSRIKSPVSAFSTTLSDFDLRDMLLDGTIYRTTKDGGALKSVLKALGRPCGGQDEAKYPISGYFNPIKQIVSFYANAFGGRLGDDLKIAEKFNDKPIKRKTLDLVRTIWGWSNLDHRSAEMTTLAANQGTVGIRIVYKADPSPRIYLDFDHPAFIKRADLDNRGNVISVFLDYTGVRYTNEGNVEDTFRVEETISKYGFSQKFDGQEQLSDDQRLNPMELCPYVLLRHDLVPGATFGRHAYDGSERAIHGINFGLSQLDESIVAHVWPYLFATSPAKKPAKFTTGRYTLVYAQSEAGKPQPTLETLVPSLDFAGALENIKAQADWMRERQPQMVLNSISLLSGISGETLAQVLKPAEAESARARALYEDAVIRAIKIGMSIGIFSGVDGFDLGTGRGTKEAADRAFDDGEGPEAFAFADRPALPPTVFQKIQQVEAEAKPIAVKVDAMVKAEGIASISRKEVLRLGGYTDEQIDAIQVEQADENSVAVADDGGLPPDTAPADAVLADQGPPQPSELAVIAQGMTQMAQAVIENTTKLVQAIVTQPMPVPAAPPLSDFPAIAQGMSDMARAVIDNTAKMVEAVVNQPPPPEPPAPVFNVTIEAAKEGTVVTDFKRDASGEIIQSVKKPQQE